MLTCLIVTPGGACTCAGAKFDGVAGSSVVIHRGAHHGFINVTDTPARMLAIFSPGAIEAMFPLLHETPLEGWDALARRYDTVIVGPPVTG